MTHDASILTPPLRQKRDDLIAKLKAMRRVVVAFSGGVDSSVVAKAAYLALPDHAWAITALSPSVSKSDRDDAKHIAQVIGIRHSFLETHEFDQQAYQKNDGSRCYHCKSELYAQIRSRYTSHEGWVIVSGANLDDRGDYRPGLTAAAVFGVRHPLQEACLTKAEVRLLAREWSLPNADKPASPCLSSRIAPGVAATPERVAQIEAAEVWLKAHGFSHVRVRLHSNEMARIEVSLDSIPLLLTPVLRNQLVQHFKSLGFQYVTLDLEGFRSGNMNQLIALEYKNRFLNQEVSGERSSTARP